MVSYSETITKTNRLTTQFLINAPTELTLQSLETRPSWKNHFLVAPNSRRFPYEERAKRRLRDNARGDRGETNWLASVFHLGN
jgi:hypothetical protein